MNKKTPHVAIFISFSGQGGVEKMICNLAGGLLDRGCRVDLVMAGARGDHLEAIPEGVKQIRCSKKHTFSALPDLIRYLKREAPDGLLAAKDRAVRVAVLAKWLSGYNGLLAGRIGTTVSEALSGKGFLRRWVWYRGMRSFYTRADHIVAVSEGVAADIRSITGMSSSEVPVIPNPVITPDLQAKSREAVTHPWLQEGKHPVVLGVGRMTEQKDFQTLIKAFALAREKTPCRLVILGEGKQRDILNKLICTLNIEDDVFLPGFVKNPYPWISGSSLFVLSSKWEGSPNALTEALALGRPVVSTDCRSGPREILADGRYGKLVPVGDEKALAEAIVSTLENPPPEDYLKEAVKEYSLESSVEHYLELLIPG